MERHSLSCQHALQQIRQLKIESESDARQKFHHRYFRTKPVPNRTQLKTNCASANHNELLWRFPEFERFGAADDYFAVKFRERQFHRCAAGGDDDVLCFDLLRLTIRGFNRNFSGSRDRGKARKNSDLVGFHQRPDAAVERLYDFILALLHFRKIDTRAVDHDAMLRRLFFDEHEMIARREKRLTRDAPYVQASAA